MTKPLLKAFFVVGVLLLWDPALGQEGNSVDTDSRVRQLISFLEFNLNTLGNPKTPTSEKEIIINQSFLKFFKDSEVQIEDDLVDNREMVTNKDVQAYLKDVDFFYREVQFTLEVQSIEASETEAGDPFFKVTCNRNLTGFNLDGDSINNNLARFIEINLDPAENDLKIASIYTTGLSREAELISWWQNLSLEWSDVLKRKIGAQDSLSNAQILEVAEIEELDISFNPYLTDLNPVSELTELKVLNISNTQVQDLFPIRTLTNLEKLDISNTGVEDLEPIKYAIKTTDLNFSATPVLNLQPIAAFRNLVRLEFSQTQVRDLKDLDQLTTLQELNCSSSLIMTLEGIERMQRLKVLDISGTFVTSLKPLQNLDSLEDLRFDKTLIISLENLTQKSSLRVLSFNETRIGSLAPIMELPSIERVYADNAPISIDEARRFAEINPERLLIFKSQVLAQWWETTPAEWKELLLDLSGLEEPLSKEDLGKVIKLQHLDISGRTDFFNLDPLWVMVNLEKLDFSDTQVADISPLSGLEKIKEINLSKTAVVDLGPLEDLGSLERIDLSQTGILDIHSLRELALLKYVNLNSTQVKSLEGLNDHWYLEQVFLENTDIGDLTPLFGIKSLKLIQAEGSLLHDEEVAEFISNSPGSVVIYQTSILTNWWDQIGPVWQLAFKHHIDYDGTPGPEELHRITFLDRFEIEDSQILDLAPLQRLIRIESIRLNGTNTSDLSPLRLSTSLKVLEMPKNPVSDLGPISSLPKLELLDVANTAVVDLRPLAGMASLQSLKVSGTQVKNLKGLESLTQLRHLECYSTPLKSLKPIDRLKQLEILSCYNTKLSSKVSRFLKKATPIAR